MKKRKIIICVVAFCIVVLVGVFVGVSSHRDYTKALDIPQKSEISIKQYSTGKEIQLENDDADKMAEMLKEHLSYKGITYDDSVVSSEEDVYSIMISSTDFLFNPMLIFLQIHKKWARSKSDRTLTESICVIAKCNNLLHTLTYGLN